MGQTVSKEVKQLAEKAEAMLPKFNSDPASSLSEPNASPSKELVSSLTKIAKAISDSAALNTTNLEKKVSELTVNNLTLDKKMAETAAKAANL